MRLLTPRSQQGRPSARPTRSRRWPRTGPALLLTVLTAVLLPACGDDISVGTAIPINPTTTAPTATPDCGRVGQGCNSNADCCSGLCDFLQAVCR